MPEGPEVKHRGDLLKKELENYMLHSIEIDDKSRYNKKPINNIDNFKSQLPLKIVDVSVKGKVTFFHLENDIYLMCHYGMEGNFTFSKGKHSNLWFDISKDDLHKTLYYDDTRHFGTINILMSEQRYKDELSNIGVDILSEDITFENFKEIVLKKKNWEICKFLMDQKYISGIGNYLKAEILYFSKVIPNKLIKDLSEIELNNLYKYSKKIPKDSYLSNGYTLKTYSDILGKKGEYTVSVYGNSKDMNGNTIIRSTFKDGRTTWWCPEVQK